MAVICALRGINLQNGRQKLLGVVESIMVKARELAVLTTSFLPRRQRDFLRKFLKRNRGLVEKKTILIFQNNGLGIVRLLHLINMIGEDHIISIRSLGSYVPSDWPSEYVKLARTKKLGKRQRAQLSRSPGIAVEFRMTTIDMA